MGITIGPADWWIATPESFNSLAISCCVGTTLPDGSIIICKAGGCAWIVAPCCTQISSTWAGGQYNTTQVGEKCCICEWPGLQTRLIDCGFNPCDWFVPSSSQLNTPGYACRSQWDTFDAASYWSSSECNDTIACRLLFSNGTLGAIDKTSAGCVRAFRCVTY